MTDLISAELAATCAALGFYDGINYYLDSHCLDVIKDLIKFLKRDDDDHTVRRYLGHAKLLETDLLKIFVHHSDKIELWDVLLRLLINLTSPALMVYNEQLPSEKTARNMYEQLVVYLQAYKVALADERVWSVVGKRLKNIMNMDTTERGEEDELVIERILTLIRNVLQVPPNDNEKRAENDATIHDEVLFALNTSGLVDMLLFIASNVAQQQYHIQVLEIVALMLREQCPTKLASVGLERSTIEKERDAAKLVAIRDKEVHDRMERMKKYAGSRHSKFGGTFVVQNMKAIGNNQLICHKPYRKIEALEFGRDKTKMKRRKRSIPMSDTDDVRTSALSVRLFLKEFSVEFLNGAYNPVMRYARSCINGGGGGGGDRIPPDATYYLWTLRFFMEFNRRYKFQVKYVSETISTETFHLVQTQLEHCDEMMKVDKKKSQFWFKRLQLAVKAYLELLYTLIAMDSTSDEAVKESSRVIKSNVFYVPEYRETILSQLLHYDDVKMSSTYLIDLVTTAHVFLKILRQFCGQARTLIVSKKTKKRIGKKKKSSNVQTKATGDREKVTTTSLQDMWDEAAPEISAVMREGTIIDVVPFDATLQTPINDQKSTAMMNIQKSLRKKNFETAIGLLRSAREVWPENDSFGKPDIPVEEEFLALREIFFAQLDITDNEDDRQNRGADETNEEENDYRRDDSDDKEDGGGGDDDDDDNDNEDEYGGGTMEETNFKFDAFLRRFANVKMVKAMAMLLRRFDENSSQVNHYVVKMLHRIAVECQMPGMMFQASLFRTFQKILHSKSSRHQELKKFAVFVIRGFAQVTVNNPKAYMELLFWKGPAEATEMVEGYGVASTEDKVSGGNAWTETEENELRTLFMEHQTNKPSQDLIDWILDNIISDDRTRRGIIKKLKEMSLIVNSKATKSQVQKRLPKEWSEHEINELSALWQRVKEDQDPIDAIHDTLTIKRSKKAIKEKLLDMNLAKNAKELRKKRVKDRDHDLAKSFGETKSVNQERGNNDGNGGRNGSNSSSSSSSSTTTSSSSSSSEDTDTDEIHPNRISKKRRRVRPLPTIVYTDDQLSGLLKDVIERHMRQGLEWLKESLQEIIEDRNEESSEDIPLVPVSEDSSAAMDSPSFQRFLRAIGIVPPANEQERYWRVPGCMLTATIRKRCSLIENTFVPREDNPVVADNLLPNDDETKRAHSEDSDSSNMTTVKRRRVIISDDDDDDDDDNNNDVVTEKYSAEYAKNKSVD